MYVPIYNSQQQNSEIICALGYATGTQWQRTSLLAHCTCMLYTRYPTSKFLIVRHTGAWLDGRLCLDTATPRWHWKGPFWLASNLCDESESQWGQALRRMATLWALCDVLFSITKNEREMGERNAIIYLFISLFIQATVGCPTKAETATVATHGHCTAEQPRHFVPLMSEVLWNQTKWEFFISSTHSHCNCLQQLAQLIGPFSV